MKTVNKILTVALLATITTAPIYAGGGGSGSHAKNGDGVRGGKVAGCENAKRGGSSTSGKNGGGVRGKYA